MKTLNVKTTSDIFVRFTLTSIEMIKIRGGQSEDEPVIKANIPPVKI